MNAKQHREYQKDHFTISDDPARLNIDLIYDFLTNSYWSPGIPLQTVKTAIQHSVCFGVYDGAEQIGFARIITDYATLAHLKDVFILDNYRGLGLGKWLVECMLAHPDLQNIRRWTLNTADAHGLYARFGFKPVETSGRLMERIVSNDS